MILSFLFFAFVAYLIFKLVADFIWPVYRTTRRVSQQFRQMNRHTRQKQGGQAPANRQPKHSTDARKSPLGEYIDFEEVKEK